MLAVASAPLRLRSCYFAQILRSGQPEPSLNNTRLATWRSFATGVSRPVAFPLSSLKMIRNHDCIRTAGCLIIGDEILNGKTLDRNSHFFAKFCFERGIELKRIEVVPDRQDDIILASRRMVRDYDLTITSGGIGSTHDDITYSSLAKAFFQNLKYHDETLRRMEAMNKLRNWTQEQTADQKIAMRRMALFPDQAEIIFVHEKIWVPVVCLESKLFVLPGIPVLFEKMLLALSPFLRLPPEDERPHRVQVYTEQAESSIAPYLTDLQNRLKAQDIQVGSYPIFGQGVFVSLIGRSNSSPKEELLRIAREVEGQIQGRIYTEEQVIQMKKEAVSKNGPLDELLERTELKAKF